MVKKLTSETKRLCHVPVMNLRINISSTTVSGSRIPSYKLAVDVQYINSNSITIRTINSMSLNLNGRKLGKDWYPSETS